MNRSKNRFHWCVENARDRLTETLTWFPLPALIGFGLVAVLTAQVLPGLNPRLGQPTRLINFNTDAEAEGSIWMSVSIDAQKHQLVITTSDRKVLRFDSNVTDIEDLAPLIDHLQQKVTERLKSAALARHASTTEISAVLAVDETVKFGLVRPIVNAIAMAGITDYAFETVLTREY